MKSILHLALFTSVTTFFVGCGALEPKFYPNDKTITSKLFPIDNQDKNDPELEQKIKAMFSGEKEKIVDTKNHLLKDDGRLLIINSLTTIDTDMIEKLKNQIKNQNSHIQDVEFIAVSSLPNLNTIRVMGAKQNARYVLILNSFSNTYRYHNEWTIPTIFGLGIPYFFLDTQTIKVYVKVEYSLIDILDNTILFNESVTSEAQTKSTLPESGIAQYEVTNKAMKDGLENLSKKLIQKLQ